MPLPLIPIILGILAAGTAAGGVVKGTKAIKDNSEANDVNERAQDIYAKAKRNLENARDVTGKSLEKFGRKKVDCCATTVRTFLDLFNLIKNIELEEGSLDELSSFKIDKQAIADFNELSMLATSMVTGTASGVVAGGAVAFGAYGAAGALATASTGTAIGTLSGAAATNATLAFFGGGSLAAGGLGVAGGMAVLGGIVAGPALLVLGAVMGAKASQKLDDARSNLANAKKASAELDVLVTACKAIKERSDLFTTLLIKVDLLMVKMNARLHQIIRQEGLDYKHYSNTAKDGCQAVLATASALAALLRTPLLDENGKLRKETLTIAQNVQSQLGI